MRTQRKRRMSASSLLLLIDASLGAEPMGERQAGATTSWLWFIPAEPDKGQPYHLAAGVFTGEDNVLGDGRGLPTDKPVSILFSYRVGGETDSLVD
jgi:hypothetical protein